jgi:hypothetical protein
MTASPTCTCTCLGCEHFHLGGTPPTEGQDAHHTRILLALDLSLAAACRSRGVPACNGQGEDPHTADGCDVGALHTCAGELAIALAAMLEERGGLERAVAALEQLDAELGRVLGNRPHVS